MKEKIKLSGVPETMLQTIYARAKESGGRGRGKSEREAHSRGTKARGEDEGGGTKGGRTRQ